MSEPTTEAGRRRARIKRNDDAWVNAPEGFDGIHNHPETQCQADIDRHDILAIEAEARASLDVDDCDSILLALGHFPTWFDGTALKVTALRVVLAEKQP